MNKAKKRQRTDPTAAELADQISKIPQRLGIWRAGQHGLHHLLFASSLARLTDVTRSNSADSPVMAPEITEVWRHTTSTLVEWHSRFAAPQSGEPVAQNVTAAVERAKDWRALETVAQGLRNGEMRVGKIKDWHIRIENTRDHSVEVLDILLEQVSIPSTKDLSVPSIESVDRWFIDHAGRPYWAQDLPKWVQGVMYRRALGDLVNRGLTMPEATDLGGVTLAEARKCYAFLLARTQLADLCTTVLHSKETAVWYVEPQSLRGNLINYVSDESADAFMHLCSYGPGRNPTSAPLIGDEPLIAIPSALVSPIGFERALLRAASADPARAGQLGNALGRRAGRWADRLRTVPRAMVAERLQVRNRDGQRVGDLDVVAFDPEDNLMVVVETKWPVDAHTLRETVKIDDQVDKGRQQLSSIQAVLADGGTVRWPTRWNVRPDVSFRWWVGTAQQLSTRPSRGPDDIRTTSLRLVEHVLPAVSIADLQDRLEHFPLPRRGIEYELIDQTVRAGRYRMSFPAIAILADPPVPPEGRRTNLGWT